MSGQVLPDQGPNRRPRETPIQKAHLERLVAHYGSSTGVAPGRRLEIQLMFRGRSWATLRLDVAAPDSRSIDGEFVPAIPLDEFGIAGPEAIPCLSLRYQIAQKLHAVTERFPSGDNERFRDLIDLIICRDLVERMDEVKKACRDTFAARGKHTWPPELVVPDIWTEPYSALAEEMDFPIAAVEEAAAEVRELITAIDAA